MADQAREFAMMLAAFDRRLRALETGPRAGNTSVRNGFLRFLPPDGTSANPQVYLSVATRPATLSSTGLVVPSWAA